MSVCLDIGCGTLCDLVPVFFGVDCGTLCRSSFCMLRCWMRGAVPIYFYLLYFFALDRMYICFYSLLSAVEFSAGDVAAVWAAAEEV